MAADLSVASPAIFLRSNRVSTFKRFNGGDETSLATSGQWLIWQTDDGDANQSQNSLQIGNEKAVSFGSQFSHYATEDQKLTVTDEIAWVVCFVGPDNWSYESVAESVADWLPNAVVEPNFIVNVDSVPNSSNFGEQWGLNNTGQSGGLVDADIDAVEAWDISTGSSDGILQTTTTPRWTTEAMALTLLGPLEPLATTISE